MDRNLNNTSVFPVRKQAGNEFKLKETFCFVLKECRSVRLIFGVVSEQNASIRFDTNHLSPFMPAFSIMLNSDRVVTVWSNLQNDIKHETSLMVSE